MLFNHAIDTLEVPAGAATTLTANGRELKTHSIILKLASKHPDFTTIRRYPRH
jgi:hypothetical protein